MEQAIAPTLQALDRHPEPRAQRFDDGLGIAGSVVVLPSAFNPPTMAHQHLLERAVESAHGARPVALLTTKNVDKELHGASLAQRVEMLLSLRTRWPELAVIACNQARIIDQAEALTASFQPPGAELDLRFVVGFDTLERLFARRYYADMERELTPFFERCRVFAANRAAMSANDVSAWVSANAAAFADRIDVLEIEEFAASLSSTGVRESLKTGGAADTVAEPVRRYIEMHGIYRERFPADA